MIRIIAVDKKVKLALLAEEDNIIMGEVWLKRYGLWTSCLASKIAASGFSSITADHSLLDHRFIKRLEAAEKKAIKQSVGRWAACDKEKKPGLFAKLVNFLKTKWR